MTPKLTRRQFLALAGVGVAGAGLYILFRTGKGYLIENFDEFLPPIIDDPNAWLRITPENRAELIMSKAEMGQGVQTAFAQIVADELFLPFESVDVIMPDTTVMPADIVGTAGSGSVSSMYPVLQKAAARARELLKAEAAKLLNVTPETIAVQDGVIVVEGQRTEHTYGSLIGGKQIVVESGDTPAPVKAVSDHTVIGKPKPRVDIPAKVNGSARYGYDARMEGMKFGKVLRPPTIGATLKNVKVSAAEKSPGVLQIVRDSDFVGVIAETQEAANVAINLIAATWNERSPLLQQSDIDSMLIPGGSGGETIAEAGNADSAIQGAASVIEADYASPLAAHAALEPQGSLAYVRQENGGWIAEVWTATQAPTLSPAEIARAIGLQAEQVILHNYFLGGGFGRKLVSDSSIEAARLSKASGLPVRVNWDRAEEFQHAFMRPPTRHRLRAGLDSGGNVVAWIHEQSSGWVLFAFLPKPLQWLLGIDLAATRGAVPAYAFPNHRTTAWLRDIPAKTGPWRGLGLLPNGFAVESFVDELAHAANADPLEFRLRHLGDDSIGTRLKRVLQTVADMAVWSAPLPARNGWLSGRGLACGEDVKTVVAQVAEVAVNPQTGEVKVERVYCALDCGLIINPDGVEAQIQGNIMWGVSSALIEEATFVDGKVRATNFGDYPILTIRQAPDVVIQLIENREEGPYGMGEPPIGPVAASIGNAIFNGTGKRLRRLPMTPERVLGA